jgi:pimeloyl-ACP methyl ester carboxylesterase
MGNGRFRAEEPSGAPPLVLLHGGPGGVGGIALYSAGVAMNPHLHSRDVVVYDQRGAGFSEPKLCPAYDSVAKAEYSRRETSENERQLTKARRACVAELDRKGIDRLAYNTVANAADLIDLRRALGYASWDIRSSSYGARLAQEAMVRDRGSTRSVVLASPRARGFPSQAEQPLSTQRAFERLFAACKLQASCHEAFPTVEQDFYAACADMTRSPLRVPILLPDGRSDDVWLNGHRLVAGIRERMRMSSGLGRIPLLLRELTAGDRMRAAREIVGDGLAPSDSVNLAVRDLVNCYDDYGPRFLKTLQSVNARVRPPFRRPVSHCGEWLPRFGDASTRTPVRSDIPTLITSGYFDDRTPAEQARRIASTLSRAFLVEFPDEAHDARPMGCHLAIVMQFLEDPTRKLDTSCVSEIPPTTFATTWENGQAR